MANVVKVFVYGTLKRGFPNHGLLGSPPQGIVKFIAEGRTKEKYPLVIATEASIPIVLPFPGEGKFVEGEIYEVDQEALENLDKLEDHPVWYKRTPCPIITTEEQQTTEVMCDIYILTKPKKELRTLPFSSSYTKEQSAKYTPPQQRSHPASLKQQTQDI